MQIFTNYYDVLDQQFSNFALTIGSFDGVHLGHRALIQKIKEKAENAGSAILTFDPHPQKVLSQKPSPLLFSIQDQEDIFRQLQIDVLFKIPFDKNFANLEAKVFVDTYIQKLFRPSYVAVGYDFVFGKGRDGNGRLLQSLLNPYGCQVEQIPPLKMNDKIVSSSYLRELLANGQVSELNPLLGRPYYLKGLVQKGKQMGRTLGFPTANLNCSNEIFPAFGVYFCSVVIEQKIYKAVTNIGLNPTLDNDHKIKIESHILNFNKDLYGKELAVFFYEKLRDEQRFSSRQELSLQIQKDVSTALIMNIPEIRP